MKVIVSVVLFGAAVCVQAILHRFLVARGIRSVKTFLAYPLGFIGMLLFFKSAEVMVIYALLSAAAFIFFITPVLGDTAPTSRILFYLREHRRAPTRTLVQLFSDKEMIEKRLDDLEGAGLVREKGRRYTATVAGRFIAWAIGRYVAIIAWEPSV